MRSRWIGSIVAVAALVLGLAVATAQMATPAAGISYPAHIHIGPCDNLGAVVYPLNDASGAALSGTPIATPVASPVVGEGTAIAGSQTDVDASLATLLDGGFAINVHRSAAQMDQYIACGEIIGDPADGTLIVPLGEQNGSGVAGQARLRDLGNGRTRVTITLTAAPAQAMASPAASPISG